MSDDIQEPTPQASPFKTVAMRCRKPECGHNKARNISLPSTIPGTYLYQCEKCGYSWTVQQGGHINI